MPGSWTITADWESLDSGSLEEQACFAALGIYADNVCLTEGKDSLANRLRYAPLLSGYHLAEWLAWNWWRLRWEPRSKAPDWIYAHSVATIGGGYIWPNLNIYSDGQRTTIVATPTPERPQTPFRYIANHSVVIPASEFEDEIDIFIDQVLQRLDLSKITQSNLHDIWNGVNEERCDERIASLRKIEALMGREPDQSDPQILENLLADAEQLSLSGIEELAAEHGQSGAVHSAAELQEVANQKGFDASPRNTVRLQDTSGLPGIGQAPAWVRGYHAARALREQEGLNGECITDCQLCDMSGVQADVLNDKIGSSGISFALDQNSNRSRIVLRSKWHDGRRFELARLLGDRLVGPNGGRLFPATRAYTYRQKMQRAFAAEFLSPFEAVDEMLKGDYSVENQKDVSEHFKVSELTIRTLLVNHRRLEREDLDLDFEAAAV